MQNTHVKRVRDYLQVTPELAWFSALLIVMAIGWTYSTLLPSLSISPLFISALLAIGLYAAATGIDIHEARKDKKLILSAITIGVLAKALIIGVICSLLISSPLGLIAGVIYSQIDPLSVAAMQHTSRMSTRAKHTIHAWATFDDPVSVLLARYILPFAVAALGSSALSSMVGGLIDWVIQLLLNLLLGFAAFIIWRLIRGHRYASYFETGLLIAALLLAIGSGLLLAVAIIGLFLRPISELHINKIVLLAYACAVFLIGTLLTGTINLGLGIIIGIIAYATHYIVSEVLTRWQGLNSRDRLHIGLGQQSGLTACNLIILFATVAPTVIAICIPALVVINLLHLTANSLLARNELRISR